jgi:hypothetical protein
MDGQELRNEFEQVVVEQVVVDQVVVDQVVVRLGLEATSRVCKAGPAGPFRTWLPLIFPPGGTFYHVGKVLTIRRLELW